METMGKKSIKVTTTREELQRKVLFFSISSRIFALLLSFASNIILPDHDANVYSFPSPQVNHSWLDKIVKVVFGGLARWDAQYFLHIAHHGYTYENTLAFFPFFPVTTRVVAQVLDCFTGSYLNCLSTVLISSILLNVFFFVKAATTLFELSCRILQDDKLAYTSTLFFCINPASVFFSAPYSESCFAFFTFSGMLYCVTNTNLLSSVVFGISNCIRSNGIVNFGFVAHKTLRNLVEFTSLKKSWFALFYNLSCELIKLCIHAVIFILPFMMFQTYAYLSFCFKEIEMPKNIQEFGISNNYVMPGSQLSGWCNYSIPFSYSYVQNHYWNVGFLKYFEFKQIPNFLLAFPIHYIIISQSYSFLTKNRSYMISLGLMEIEFVKCFGRNVRPEFFLFVVQALFLSIFGFLCIHVQVTTRMIASSCPVLYWFVALNYKTDSKSEEKKIQSRLNYIQKPFKHSFVETQENLGSWWKVCVLTDIPADRWSYLARLYFLFYFILGTVLFSNFYPWT